MKKLDQTTDLRNGEVMESKLMNIDALRGGVAPKSNASVRTVCFILEAPCLGD